MDNDELRQRQLARLRGEVFNPVFNAGSAQFVPDPELDADYNRYCASERNWEREPEPREVWEREHKESMQRLNIQPENPPETPFIVGNRDEYGDLQALPAPRWPSPGQPKTQEISKAHFEEGMLQCDANHALTDCVRWLAQKLRDPDCWDNPCSGPPAKLFDVAWSFLLGTFRARNIEPPSDTQMLTWAKEYNEEHTRKRTHAKA